MDNHLSSSPFPSEYHDDMMHLPADESRWSCSDDCVKVCQERINIRWSLPIMRHTVLIHPDIDHQHHRYEEDESFLILIKQEEKGDTVCESRKVTVGLELKR